jgi:hypothetical protein
VSALTDLSNNKIGDSTGEQIPFSLWLLIFSVAICSGFTFFLSYQSLSLQDILIDLLGPEAFLNFASFFKFLIMFRNSRTALHCSPARIGRVHTLPIGFSARFSHPAQGSPARINDSRTVLYFLPANIIFQKFGFEFWYFQLPRSV